MWFQLNFFLSLSSLVFLSKQGKVFHEAVAPFRLAFSSLTLSGLLSGRKLVGRALEALSAQERRARGPGLRARGTGRGAGSRACTWLQPPGRTPRRRAHLAKGPSAVPDSPAAKQR
jgi:hypothetical protein